MKKEWNECANKLLRHGATECMSDEIRIEKQMGKPILFFFLPSDFFPSSNIDIAL